MAHSAPFFFFPKYFLNQVHLLCLKGLEFYLSGRTVLTLTYRTRHIPSVAQCLSLAVQMKRQVCCSPEIAQRHTSHFSPDLIFFLFSPICFCPMSRGSLGVCLSSAVSSASCSATAEYFLGLSVYHNPQPQDSVVLFS